MTTTSLPARTDRRVAEWRTLLGGHARFSCALDKALYDQDALGLSEFEVLDRMVEAPESYRMLDLANEIHLSQSALSRAVARLEKDGLVTRDMCTEDRRSVYVCLTDKGAKAHREVLPTHREVLAATWDQPAG